MSNTACATMDLARSERGAVTTSVWPILPSAFASAEDTHPAILSISRIESPGTAVSPIPPVPGLVSFVAPCWKPGTRSGAALT